MRFLHVDVSMSDGPVDQLRYAESTRSSRPSMRRTVRSSSLAAFFESGLNPAGPIRTVFLPPHSAHAPMAHLHGMIERGLSRSCGLSAELQDPFLGER